ncbi:PQQ-like beta-propeller repeat protein [soil metagenome]
MDRPPFPIALAIFLALCLAPSLHAADWPRWLGPDGDAVWTETGVLAGDKFPTDEPKVIWRTEAGLGYSGPSVADGKVFVADYLVADGTVTNNAGGRDTLLGKERLRALDLATGDVLWIYEYPRPYSLSYPGGPRTTPTYADGKVYFLGAEGNLSCVDAESGDPVWTKSFADDLGAKTPIWGHAAHPLVHGQHLICVVGGQDAHTVAFDKDTGEEAWRALSAPEPGYCPPTLIKPASGSGPLQVVIWTPEKLASLDPATGAIYWDLPLAPKFNMAIAAPRLDHTGTRFFVSGPGDVGALVALGEDDSGAPTASIAWRGTPKSAAYTVNSTPFLDGDTAYACDGESSALIAFDLADGTRHWSTTTPTLGENANPRARHGTAFLTKHAPSGYFLLFNERGDLLLADLSPDGYSELDRLHLLEPTNENSGRPVVWSAPAFAEKSVLVRNDKEIIRVDLSTP